MDDTPAPRGAFKRQLLAALDRPRTREDLRAQFGEQAPKCLNNLALRREVVRVGRGSPAAYVAKRFARQYRDAAG